MSVTLRAYRRGSPGVASAQPFASRFQPGWLWGPRGLGEQSFPLRLAAGIRPVGNAARVDRRCQLMDAKYNHYEQREDFPPCPRSKYLTLGFMGQARSVS